MNVLLINSSYRTSGNTAAALSRLGAELSARGASVSDLNLARMNIGTCRGCRLCFDRGEDACPLRDDLGKTVDALRAGDIAVFASPIYVEDVNGAMKNWIDRMAFNCHRPAFHGKRAFVITTSGVGSSNHGRTTVERALRTWGFAALGGAKFTMGAAMSRETFDSRYSETTKKIAERIIRASGAPNGPQFVSALTFEIQKSYYARLPDADSFDRRFWAERGWLEPRRHFYTDARMNPATVALARALGALISRFVLR